MAFGWRADVGPLIMVFGSSLPSSSKKTVVKPPLTKFSGSAQAVTSTGPGGFIFFCVFYVRKHPKDQPAVVLVLCRLWENQESNSGLLGSRRVTYPLHHGGSQIDINSPFCFFNNKMCRITGHILYATSLISNLELLF